MKYVNVQPNMSWQITFIFINRILCILLKDLNIKTWDEKYSYRLKKQIAKHKKFFVRQRFFRLAHTVYVFLKKN